MILFGYDLQAAFCGHFCLSLTICPRPPFGLSSSSRLQSARLKWFVERHWLSWSKTRYADPEDEQAAVDAQHGRSFSFASPSTCEWASKQPFCYIQPSLSPNFLWIVVIPEKSFPQNFKQTCVQLLISKVYHEIGLSEIAGSFSRLSHS